MTTHEPIVRATDLVKCYDRGRIRALDRVSLEVNDGEFVAVTGPSGSGKSTLLHILGALDRPDSGSVRIAGRDIATERRLDRVRAESIGFVFQLHNLIPTLTARENVEIPLHASPIGARERRDRARQRLADVGLEDRMTHRPSELSGGERQRVAIARALVNEPKVLLADEPTGDLDQASGRMIIDLLTRLRDDSELTLILVTHDLEIAATADRTVRILDGAVAG